MIIPDLLQKWILYYFEGQIILIPLFILYGIGLKKKNVSFSFLNNLHKFLISASIIIPFIFLFGTQFQVNGKKTHLFIDEPNTSDLSEIMVSETSLISGELSTDSFEDMKVHLPADIISSVSKMISAFRNHITAILFSLSTGGLLYFLYLFSSQKLFEKKLRINALSATRSHDIEIITSSSITKPFSSGLMNSRIYLPDNLTESEISVVLSHELSHIQSGDLFWIFTDNLIGHIFWFNPLVLILRKGGRNIREFVCDRNTMKKYDPIYYANVLYNTSLKAIKNRQKLVLAANWETKNMLNERFNQILNEKVKPSGKMKLTVILLIIVSIAILPGILSCNKIASFEEAEISAFTNENKLNDQTGAYINNRDLRPILEFPVLNGKITWEYGSQIHPFSGETYLHKGIDIAFGIGADIFAAADGTVIEKGYEPEGFGYYLKINHGNGIVTFYSHLQIASTFNIGDNIIGGERIAQMGNSGLSNGPHLHFEILIGNQSIDPLAYFIDNNKVPKTVTISAIEEYL